MQLIILAATLSVGGTEKFIKHFANYVQAKNTNVIIYVLRNSHNLQDQIQLNSSSCIKEFKIETISNLFAFRKEINEIANDNPTTFLGFHFAGNIATLLIKKNKKTKIYTSRRRDKYSFTKVHRNLLLTLAEIRSAGILCNSPHLMYGKINRKKLVFFPNSILTYEKNRYILTKRDSSKIVVTTIANLRPEKSLDVLLSIAGILGDKYVFQIAGEGPLRHDLENTIKSLNLPVKLLGTVKDVETLLENSDLYLHTSSSEGFPNAILEAMSIGLPVVTSNIPVVELLIQSKDCIFQINQPKEASEIISNLISDHKRLLKISEENFTHTKSNFEQEAVFSKILTYLSK